MNRWIVFMVLTAVSPPFLAISGNQLQTSLGWDGTGLWYGSTRLKWEEWSLGATIRWDTSDEIEGMVNIQSPFLSIGRLSHSGLLAEVDNPGHERLLRVSERTVVRVDAQAFSLSRFGINLMSQNQRLGFGWERRSVGDVGFLWGMPIERKVLKMDVLVKAGLLNSDDSESQWYPDKPGNPGGPFMLAASRIRGDWGSLVLGLTGILSAGVNMRPGYCIVGALNYSTGPWSLRSRGTWASEYFRTSDGKRLDSPAGLGVLGRYIPAQGPRFALFGSFPFLLDENSNVSANGWISSGWAWPNFILDLRLKWNSLTESAVPFKLDFSSQWSTDFGHFDFDFSWTFHMGWEGSFSWEKNILKDWFIETSFGLEKYSVLLGRLSIRTRWVIRDNVFVLALVFKDFPRDWQPQPSGVGDLTINLRWFLSLDD